jgi:hypothetical protein
VSPAQHLELIVEEPSMEAALQNLLPKLIPHEAATWSIHPFQGKAQLLKKLPQRMKGYAQWLPPSSRIIVIVDRDQEDCRSLKAKLEEAAKAAGLVTRTAAAGKPWQVVNRIAVEELEAWFFGDPEAVRAAFPKVSAAFETKRTLRQPDAIAGGTWEALERLLQSAGYHLGGLQKIAAATEISRHMDWGRNRSPSFHALKDALTEALRLDDPAPEPAAPRGAQASLPLLRAPGPLPPLPANATIRGSRWLARLLWSLEWARRTERGALRATDLGRLLRENAGLNVPDTNVARAFRELRTSPEADGLWNHESQRFVITPAGSLLITELLGSRALADGSDA